jgi:hypothetical protein
LVARLDESLNLGTMHGQAVELALTARPQIPLDNQLHAVSHHLEQPLVSSPLL